MSCVWTERLPGREEGRREEMDGMDRDVDFKKK